MAYVMAGAVIMGVGILVGSLLTIVSMKAYDDL